MKKQKRTSWILLFLFLGSFGFASGGAFLLFFMVPLEGWFVQKEFSQQTIDILMKVSMGIWGLLVLALGAWFYRYVRKKKKKWSYGVVLLSCIASIFVFYLFINPNSSVVTLSRGVEETTNQFTFGPYPDEQKLKELKDDGYEGVITLMSPTIPFEKVLLEKEQKIAKDVGITLHSFPMLPWVSDNKESLQQIKELVANNDGKFYVHCYLGKHRVDMVREVIADETGEQYVKDLEMLPKKLERGPLRSLKGGDMLLGPFPTQEEWFHLILRKDYQEVVSTLDPSVQENVQWIEQAKKIAKDYELTFTEIPVQDENDTEQIRKVAQHIKAQDHKIYAYDFKSAEVVKKVESILRFDNAYTLTALPPKFERGELYPIGRSMLLGPYPTESEVGALKRAGIKTVVSLLDNNKPEDQQWIEREAQWTKQNGFSYHHYSTHQTNFDLQHLKEVMNAIDPSEYPVYFHGFTSDLRVKELAAYLDALHYGFTNEQLMEGFSTVKRDLVVGPMPTDTMWDTSIKDKPFQHIIVVNLQDSSNPNWIETLDQQTWSQVILKEGYLNEIIDKYQKEDGNVLIVAPDYIVGGIVSKLNERITLHRE